MTVAEYIAALPPPRRARLQQLHLLITRLFPAAVVNMQYKMPTYRVGDGWVAVANQKHYVSLYTCGYHHIEGFKKKHPKIKTGKGCINFRDGDELPLNALQFVVNHAIRHPK